MKTASLLPILLCTLVGCATPRTTQFKYENIVVNDAYAWTDGGTITMSITAYRNLASSDDFDIMFVSSLGRGSRLPNRLYVGGRLVPYDSPEESAILGILKQLSTSDHELANYRRFAEHQLTEATIANRTVESLKDGLASTNRDAETVLSLKSRIEELTVSLPPKGTVEYLEKHLPPYPDNVTRFSLSILRRYRHQKDDLPKQTTRLSNPVVEPQGK